MANTRYFLAENYRHFSRDILPGKRHGYEFPVCRWCGADIYVDDTRKEWACSNPGCRLS